MAAGICRGENTRAHHKGKNLVYVNHPATRHLLEPSAKATRSACARAEPCSVPGHLLWIAVTRVLAIARIAILLVVTHLLLAMNAAMTAT